MHATEQTIDINCFELKASLFTLPILQLTSVNLQNLPEQLDRKAIQAPNFFHNTPIVIDLQKLPTTADIDFVWLNKTLRAHSMVPVGIRSGGHQLQQGAKLAGLAILPEKKEDISTHKPQKSDKVDIKNTIDKVNKLVTKPIRSGQQVFADKGDLVIIAPVSEGAEILAHGNIHVYGTLRGRALAGVNGDTQARIFCHELKSELVAIAGQYKLLENKTTIPKQGPLQVYLKNDQLIVEAFNI